MEDNEGTIAMSKNTVKNSRTKRIDVRYHFIRQTIEAKAIQLNYRPSKEMLADILPKLLPRIQLEKLRYTMGLKMRS